MHLIIDGYGAQKERLEDRDVLFNFLNDYPDAIGMTKITEPFIYDYDGGQKPEDWGVSGFVLIAESHISIHTFPHKGYLNIDIFSCKDFDHERAVKELTDKFAIADVKSWTLDRGLDQVELHARVPAG